MKTFIKIFALIMFLSFGNVEAANLKVDSEKIIFQELRGNRIIMPRLPYRVSHRPNGRKLQRPAPRRIEVPSRRVSPPPTIYTQRQPKKPSVMNTPRLPQKNWNQRGSRPKKVSVRRDFVKKICK